MKSKCECLISKNHYSQPSIKCNENATHICTSGKYKGLNFCTKHANEGIRFGYKMTKIM